MRGSACFELVACSCGALVWRPAGSTPCLTCEDEDAAVNVEILLGEKWEPARIVAWPRPWEALVEYTVTWCGRPMTVHALVDRDSANMRRVMR